ncbi:MAG: tyrosine-type recombinase/integrase [Gemmatimonadota bacterium]|nr:MAG: tyrosine-type recombinase/integrase [Gemmatimonadota bacterium]
MPRRAKEKGIRDRMYERDGRGWYLDLRDVGGGRLAIVDKERGEKGACQDFDRAFKIAEKMIAIRGRDPKLEAYAKDHLERKRRKWRAGTVERDRYSLDTVIGFGRRMLGREPHLSDITKGFVQALIAWRGPQVSSQTLAHELHALSNLMRRAVGEDRAITNPVPTAKELEEFSVTHGAPEWWEVGEAAKLLRLAGEADAEARKYPQRCPCLRPIIGFGLLTGARPNEIFGAQRSDVDFDGGRILIRHNEYRLLKRLWHEREVPLWPQLREILEEHIDDGRPQNLIFPSHITGGMYTNIRDALRMLCKEARIFKRPRLYITRHTYCATRLQTLDGGEPISPYTVAAEMGHRDLSLIMRVYGHLQRDRLRLDRVEYREADVTVLKQKAAAS